MLSTITIAYYAWQTHGLAEQTQGLAEATSSLQVELSKPQPVVRVAQVSFDSLARSEMYADYTITNYGSLTARKLRMFGPIFSRAGKRWGNSVHYPENVSEVLEPGRTVTGQLKVGTLNREALDLSPSDTIVYLHFVLSWKDLAGSFQEVRQIEAVELAWDGDGYPRVTNNYCKDHEP
jgi:hypothetical protein